MNVKNISIKIQLTAEFIALPAFINVLNYIIFLWKDKVRHQKKPIHSHSIQVKQAAGLSEHKELSLQQDSPALITTENVPTHFDALAQSKIFRTDTEFLAPTVHEQPPGLPQQASLLSFIFCITTGKKKVIPGHFTAAYPPKLLTNKIIF